VDLLDPAVVVRGICVLDVLLEDDHVAVGHLLGRGGGEHGSGFIVDSADVDDGRR
jgi:hypothetical protein